jgi:uracil-DNA glycosylase family 4
VRTAERGLGGVPALAARVLACRLCPRLVAYHEDIGREQPAWHLRPVPGFGDPKARIVLVGLAPSKTGGNRTGRIFTGDKTAEFLFKALHETGLSNLPQSLRKDDGLELRDLYLTPALKCAPPHDKPLPQELRNCFPFLEEELRGLPQARVVIGMGKIAHDVYLRFRGKPLSAHPFKHGFAHRLSPGPVLLDTYHCSPRNTNTGVLSMKMLVAVLEKAKALAAARS